VIVVSRDERNLHPRANTVLVIPLSTSIHHSTRTHLLLRTGETGLREDCVAKAEDISVVRRADLDAPVIGQRPVTHPQICRLGSLVKIAMGCAEL
jgi:mRNA-degrading endonuclease toxin of MazEF toxin-antitoxin module